MKRIMAIIAVVVSTFVLVSCGSKMNAKFEITSASELRESLVFEFKLNDKDRVLKDSDFNYAVNKKGEKKVIKSNKLVFDDDEDFGSVTINGLEPGTTYVVKFTAGFEGKEVLLAKKECTTSTKGIEDAPYEITKAEEFNSLVKNDPNAHYILKNDIDFKEASQDPLFTSSKPFMGHFDGKGFTIKNIYAGKEGEPKAFGSNSYMGLFGYVGSKGIIENLNFDNNQIYAKRSSTGYFAIVAGFNEGQIKNVNITNSTLSATGTTSEYFVGGLVAANKGHGSVVNCNVNVNIIAKCSRTMFVGGIFATNAQENEPPVRNKLVDSKYNGNITVTIESTNDNAYETEVIVGGAAALNLSNIENVEANANIKVETSFKTPHKTKYEVVVGGLVGKNINDAALIKNSTTSGNMEVLAWDALDIYVGLVCGINGSNKPASASILNTTYTLPTDGKVVVKTYYREKPVEEENKDSETKEAPELLFKYGFGIVGLENSYDNPTKDNYNIASDVDVLFELYNKKQGEETEDTLKETKTIKVTKLA